MADPREADKANINYREILQGKSRLLLLASSLLPDLGDEQIETLIHSEHFCGDMNIPALGTFETQRMLMQMSDGAIKWSHDSRSFAWVDEEAQMKAREEMRKKHFGEFLDVCDAQMWLLARQTMRHINQFGKKNPNTEENNMMKVFGHDITHYFGKMAGFAAPMWEKEVSENESLGEVLMQHLVKDRNEHKDESGGVEVAGTAKYFDRTVAAYEKLRVMRNTDYEQTIAQALQAIATN